MFCSLILSIFLVEAGNNDNVESSKTGRNFFPVDTSADDEAGFRFPGLGSVAHTEFQETRIPRLIGGPPPSYQNVAKEIETGEYAIVVSGSSSNEAEVIGESVFPVDETPANKAGFRLPKGFV